MKKIISFVLAAVITVYAAVPANAASETGSANHLSGGIMNEITTVESEYSIKIVNTNRNNYSWNWASCVYSYLAESKNGLMRVQADNFNQKILIEYYDYEDLKLKSSKLIDYELPHFGAFYDAGDYYYILSGQSNPSQDNSVEVFRLTKYDTNWKRLGSASLYGENTTVPFDGGSARITHSQNSLIVRTCHEMYTSSDGHNHQANVTFEVDTDTMTVTEKATQVAFSRFGYCSHSFNQFIQYDGRYVVSIDHGDAYPRSVVLSIGDDNKLISRKDMLPISGAIGDNYTGVQVGGFEVTNTAYIVAGTTVDQSNRNAKTANIFVSSAGKPSDGEPAITNITNYPEGTASASNPHLVKVNGGLMLFWQRKGESDVTYYTFLDIDGNQISDIIPITANLSDCKPIVSGNRVAWYTSNGKSVTFYSMSCIPHHTQNIKLGDTDGDGIIKLNDLTAIVQHIAGNRTLSGYPLRNADLNGDGKVNLADATALVKLYANS